MNISQTLADKHPAPPHYKIDHAEGFTKVVRVGETSDGGLFCKIKYSDGSLSIVGVIGPMSDGNARGSCGQIEMSTTVADISAYAEGWNSEQFQMFLDVWRAYHLNDCTAGSPAQETHLATFARDAYIDYEGASHFNWARSVLAEAGLQPDPNLLLEGVAYSYGSKWLRTDVPLNALSFLQSLPDTDRQPAWV